MRADVLIAIAIAIAILLLAGLACKSHEARNADPQMTSSNPSGQQTWKMGSDRLQEFQEARQGFRIVSIAPVVTPPREIL